jgi:hypothetical protein
MKGGPWLVRLARRASTRGFCLALTALVSPVQSIFFLTAHFVTLWVPIAQQPGHAVLQGRLSLNMCLW